MHQAIARWGLVAVATCALGGAPAAAAGRPDRPLFREGEVIVKFKGRPAMATMTAAAARAGGGAKVSRTLAAAGRPQVGLVTFQRGASVENMVAALRAMPEVEYAEPNYIAYTDPIRSDRGPAARRAVRGTDGRATTDPAKAPRISAGLIDRQAVEFNNDPEGDYQDGWFWAEAYLVWPDAKPNPMVAVIDTGVDYTHPDLAGKVTKGRDWVNADTDPMDDAGHGTHVAGIVGALANNGKGIAGVSKAQILAIKVLGVTGSGSYFDIAGGITDAANNPAVKVLNLSLGGSGSSTTLQNAVQYAVSKGKLLVIAAGNANTNTPSYPAYYAHAATHPTLAPQILSVGATGLGHYTGGVDDYTMDYGCEADYSNFGDWVTIVAPGTDIFSTTPTKPFYDGYYYGVQSGYDFLSGTSMASPMVAGAASRVFSAMPAGTTAASVKQRLEGTGWLDVMAGHYLVDTDDDDITETDCWPSGAGQTADTVPALSVAAAMRRGGVFGQTFDANGRLPLPGALHQIALGTTPVSYGGDIAFNDQSYWYAINVPFNSTTPYNVRVSKTGYTAGFQTINQVLFNPGCGSGTYNCYLQMAAGNGVEVSIPRLASGYWQVVTNWYDSAYEIDQYSYTPSASILAAVGYVYGSGALQAAPYMRWLFDSFDAGPGGTEFTSIKPFYPTGAGTPYRVLLVDYDGGITPDPFHGVTTRFWYNGVLKGTVVAGDGDIATNDCDFGGGANTCEANWVANISGTTLTPVNVFGTWDNTGTGVEPYSRHGTASTRPGGRTAPPATRTRTNP